MNGVPWDNGTVRGWAEGICTSCMSPAIPCCLICISVCDGEFWWPHDSWGFSEIQCKNEIKYLCPWLSKWGCWQSQCHALCWNQNLLWTLQEGNGTKKHRWPRNPLKGSKICHPKIQYFAILIILNWKYLRNDCFRKDTVTLLCLPESRRLISHGKISFLY